MKKFISMIALAAVCLGTVAAAIPAKAVSDTTMKMKKKSSKMKMKKKMKDTTKM